MHSADNQIPASQQVIGSTSAAPQQSYMDHDTIPANLMPSTTPPSMVNPASASFISLLTGGRRGVDLQDGPSTNINYNVLSSHNVSVSQSMIPCKSSNQVARTQGPPNSNPFYVKVIQGNIRMCQGCKSTLRLSDSSVPAPPFDLAAARLEKRQFRGQEWDTDYSSSRTTITLPFAIGLHQSSST